MAVCNAFLLWCHGISTHLWYDWTSNRAVDWLISNVVNIFSQSTPRFPNHPPELVYKLLCDLYIPHLFTVNGRTISFSLLHNTKYADSFVVW